MISPASAPSSWSLAEKFGQSMHAIHDNVPGFNDGRMGPVVARIFDNLTADQLVGRYNWSIYDDPDFSTIKEKAKESKEGWEMWPPMGFNPLCWGECAQRYEPGAGYTNV